MTNPFDNLDATFLVLLNDERQHSLWPAFLAVPSGWSVAAGPASKAECLAHVESHWTDMRPASIRADSGSAGDVS